MVEQTPQPRLIVVEDEEHIAAGLKLNLELEGYAVDVVGTAREASALMLEHRYDVMILDVMLPDIDGIELCRRIRRAGNRIPVIMLTARSTPDERVQGLDAGADDYLPKPFELNELLARVRSALRRRAWERAHGAGINTGEVLTFGQARIRFESHEAWMGDQPVEMTALELDLLRYLATRAGRVVSREELLENVWKLRNYPHTRTVDNFVGRLRKHFEPDIDKPRFFVSVRGAGYKFVHE